MAYTVTMVLTQPDAGTALPLISDFSGTNKAASDTIYTDAGVVKAYVQDGLVTTVTLTSADKATYNTAKAEVDALADEASVKTSWKDAAVAAGCTCVITDSDGYSIANF